MIITYLTEDVIDWLNDWDSITSASTAASVTRNHEVKENFGVVD